MGPLLRSYIPFLERCSQYNAITESSSTTVAHTLHYSALKKASRERDVPILNEDDLEETFIKGGGPGGQCINKRNTNVPK